jgi:hypothetical protein
MNTLLCRQKITLSVEPDFGHSTGQPQDQVSVVEQKSFDRKRGYLVLCHCTLLYTVVTRLSKLAADHLDSPGTLHYQAIAADDRHGERQPCADLLWM